MGRYKTSMNQVLNLVDDIRGIAQGNYFPYMDNDERLSEIHKLACLLQDELEHPKESNN